MPNECEKIDHSFEGSTADVKERLLTPSEPDFFQSTNECFFYPNPPYVDKIVSPFEDNSTNHQANHQHGVSFGSETTLSDSREINTPTIPCLNSNDPRNDIDTTTAPIDAQSGTETRLHLSIGNSYDSQYMNSNKISSFSYSNDQMKNVSLGPPVLPYFTNQTEASAGIFRQRMPTNDAERFGFEGSTEKEDSSDSANSSLQCQHRPVPAKSAFMCFSEAKNEDILKKIGHQNKDCYVEAVAKEWRSLSNFERAHWDEMARTEKARYAKEKNAYKGPHYARKQRAKKHPLAPKRPMSAFLMFAQQRRSAINDQNPDLSNADISRLLGEMWRNASKEERTPYLEREEEERKIYKAKMESWRGDQKLAKCSRKFRPREMPLPSNDMRENRTESQNYNREVATEPPKENNYDLVTRNDFLQDDAAPLSVNLVAPSYDSHSSYAASSSIYPAQQTEEFYTAHFTQCYQQGEKYIQYTYPRPREEHHY